MIASALPIACIPGCDMFFGLMLFAAITAVMMAAKKKGPPPDEGGPTPSDG